MKPGENVETHPSYATIRFGRTQGDVHPLFGSSIHHGHTILLEIMEATLERGLNQDWIHGTKPIIEAEMSYTQFVEAITSTSGSGVPCTLRWLRGVGPIEQVPFTNKRTQFQQEFRAEMQKIAHLTDDLKRLAVDLHAAPSASKADRKAMVDLVAKVQQEIASTLPFILSQFNEQMDKTVTEAKGEFEAMVSQRLESLGLQTLQANPQLLALPDAKEAEKDAED